MYVCNNILTEEQKEDNNILNVQVFHTQPTQYMTWNGYPNGVPKVPFLSVLSDLQRTYYMDVLRTSLSCQKYQDNQIHLIGPFIGFRENRWLFYARLYHI